MKYWLLCQFLQSKNKINYVFEQISIKYQIETLDFVVDRIFRVTKEDREIYIYLWSIQWDKQVHGL